MTRRHVHRTHAYRQHFRSRPDRTPGWVVTLGCCVVIGILGLFVWAGSPGSKMPLETGTHTSDSAFRADIRPQVGVPPRSMGDADPGQSEIHTLADTIAPSHVIDTVDVGTPAADSAASPTIGRPMTVAAPSTATPVCVPPEPAAFSPAWQDDLQARHGSGAVTHPVHQETWVIASPMAVYETLTVDVCVPLGSDGAPLPTAADIVLSFPFPTEKSAVEGIARPLASRYGFTLLTIRFPPPETLGRNIPPGRHREYYYPDNGSDKAWIDAIRRTRRRFGFPERRIFATGRSGGGSATNQFVEAHPDLCDGYHSEAGRYFVADSDFSGPVLLTFGEGDVVEPENRTLIAGLEALGVTPWVIPFHTNQGQRERNHPLMRHGMPGNVTKVAWAWLAGVADLRLENRGILPPRPLWPRFGNVGMPSRHSAELAEGVAPASEPLPGKDGWIVRTAGRPRAVLALCWNDFAISTDQLLMDGHFLSDEGFMVVAGTGSAGSSVLAAAQDLARAENVPLCSIMTDASGQMMREQSKNRLACLILVRPKSSLRTAWQARSVPSIIYPGISDQVAWQAMADTDTTIAALPVGAPDANAWHVRWLRDLANRLTKLFPRR